MKRNFLDREILIEKEVIKLKDESQNHDLVIRSIITFIKTPYKGKYFIHYDTIRLDRIGQDKYEIKINYGIIKASTGKMAFWFEKDDTGREMIVFYHSYDTVNLVFIFVLVCTFILTINFVTDFKPIVNTGIAFVLIYAYLEHYIVNKKKNYIVDFVRKNYGYVWYRGQTKASP